MNADRLDKLYKAFRRDPPEDVQKQHVDEMRSRAREFLRQKIESGNLRRERSAAFDNALAEFLNRSGVSKHLSPRKLDPEAARRRLSELPVPDPPRLHSHIIRHGSVWLVEIPPYNGWATPPPAGSSSNDAQGSASVDLKKGTASLSVYAGEGVSGYGGQTNSGPGACGAFADLGNYFSPPSGVCDTVQEAQLTIQTIPVVNWTAEWHSAMGAPATLEFGLHLVVNQYNPTSAPLSTAYQYCIDGTYKYFDNWSGPLGQFNQAYSLSGSVAVSSANNYAVWVEIYAFAQAQGSGSWGSDSYADLQASVTVPSIDLSLSYNQ